MTRLLYYVTSFVGICIFMTLSLPGVASEADVAVTEEKTALELGYGVQAYECDKQTMNPLASEDRVAKIAGKVIYTKIVGTVIVICFVPNQAAIDDGIGLKEINNFKWETTNKKGDFLSRDAITNGQADGMLSTVRCLNSNNLQDQDPSELEGNSVCLLESMLTSEFYIDTASVMGSGEAIFHTKEGVDGTVPVSVDIFKATFSFTYDHQAEKLLQSMHSNSTTSTGDEDDDESLSAGEENDSVSNSDDTKENDNEDEGKDEL